MTTLLRIALVFAVLSVLGFGGGKGIIPQMHNDAVDAGWVTSAQFAQFYTLGKLVPGPTTIFSALIGYRAAGIPGAIVAAAAMFVPSTILMIGMGMAWRRFSRSKWKDTVALGLEPVIVGLVWSSVATIGKGALHGWPAYGIALAVTVLTLRTKISAPPLIALGAVAGAVALR